MKRVFCCAAICLLTVTVWAAPVTVTHNYFDITFYNSGDTNGYATGEQNWTAQQIDDVKASIDAWSGHIANTPGRQIQMHVFWEEMDPMGTNVLGGSASYGFSDDTTQWNMGEYVWKQGANAPTTDYGFDTIITYDITAAGMNWNFGTTAPTGSQIDFRSVLTHELGHSLGFSSTYDRVYDDWGWDYENGSYSGISDWDRNLIDSTGNKPENRGTGTPGNFNQLDSPVYWEGAAATALYGDLVPIYAPSSWEQGSSLSHLDEGQLGSLLMSPAIGAGQMTRTVSELEWAMMTDMGWTIIPEPATLALLGLGVLILRKQRG